MLIARILVPVVPISPAGICLRQGLTFNKAPDTGGMGRGRSKPYAIRLNDITIDISPPDVALHNPIPPADGQFAVLTKVSFEFRDFANAAAVFDFALDVWIRAAPLIVKSNGATFIGLNLIDLRLSGLGPAQFADYLEYVLGLVIRQVLGRVQIPTTFNAEGVITLVTLDVGAQSDSIPVYGAIYRPNPTHT